MDAGTVVRGVRAARVRGRRSRRTRRAASPGPLALGAACLGTLVAFFNRPRIRQHEIAIAGLPAAFDGYRVAQISDLHCGPFADGARIDRWVAAVNRLEADLVAVTGDLIASGATFVPVVAASLGKLRGRDGVFACMGNHDYFTDGEAMAAGARAGGADAAAEPRRRDPA